MPRVREWEMSVLVKSEREGPNMGSSGRGWLPINVKKLAKCRNMRE